MNPKIVIEIKIVMSEQPRKFDAVLGGNTPPPVTGVVLGGIEGVKRRLESEIVDVRIKALNDALNYGDEGLDLVIQALENDSLQVKSFASRLLKESGGEKGKQALLEFDPYLYFTKLDDWEVEEFNPEVGIVNPENKAYVVNLGNIQYLVQDERVNEVEISADEGCRTRRQDSVESIFHCAEHTVATIWPRHRRINAVTNTITKKGIGCSSGLSRTHSASRSVPTKYARNVCASSIESRRYVPYFAGVRHAPPFRRLPGSPSKNRSIGRYTNSR